MKTNYGQSIYWKNESGGTTAVHISGRETPEKAKDDAISDAKALGWTPPKWYQFWRWSDTRISDNA